MRQDFLGSCLGSDQNSAEQGKKSRLHCRFLFGGMPIRAWRRIRRHHPRKQLFDSSAMCTRAERRGGPDEVNDRFVSPARQYAIRNRQMQIGGSLVGLEET